MATPDARTDDGSTVRCDVCGERFESERALHRHIAEEGLLR